MSPLHAVVLGLVQGLTEFLPISSSGHLVVVPALLGWPHSPLAFDVLLHAASLLAVLAYFRREFLMVARGLVRPGPGRRLIAPLVVGTIPAAAAGFLLADRLEEVFARPSMVALLLLGTAAILAASEAYARRRATAPATLAAGPGELGEDVTTGRALVVGLAQAFAVLPGISRSGSTIGAGLATGIPRTDAARFSFMLSVPVLAGAALVEVPKLSGLRLGALPLALGFVAALVSSYLAIGGLIGYLQHRGLYPFAIYCAIAGPVAWLFLTR